MQNPAEQLTGVTLNEQWVVGEIVAVAPNATGGAHSICYECSNSDGTIAFVKAMDFVRAFSEPDFTRALQKLTASYNFEIDLLESCKDLSRIVVALDHGQYAVSASPVDKVVFIVFELAEKTVRSDIVVGQCPPLAWCIEVLHQVFVGVRQLHARKIAHQDIKPSNILQFVEDGAKIADLGRAVTPIATVPHKDYLWPGDLHYAPPEFMYGQVDSDFNVRRLSADLYLLGSLIVSVLTGTQFSAWFTREMDQSHLPSYWNGSFTGSYTDVQPYVVAAFESSISKIEAQLGGDNPVIAELIGMVRELCDPDPMKRGDKKTHRITPGSDNRFDLERYLARIDRLILKARIAERKQPTA